MAFQEFMIAPVGASSLTQAVQIGSEIYQELKAVIKSKFGGAGRLELILSPFCCPNTDTSYSDWHR